MPGSPIRTAYFSKTKYFFFETRHSLARGERKALFYIFYSFPRKRFTGKAGARACIFPLRCRITISTPSSLLFSTPYYNNIPAIFHFPSFAQKENPLFFWKHSRTPNSAATKNSEFPPPPPLPAKRIVYSHKTDLGRPWGLMHLRQRGYVGNS